MSHGPSRNINLSKAVVAFFLIERPVHLFVLCPGLIVVLASSLHVSQKYMGFWSSHFTKVSPDKDVFGSKETELGILKDKIKIHGRLMNWFCLCMPRGFIICAARCLCLQVLNWNQNLRNISPKTSAQTIYRWCYWCLQVTNSHFGE